MLALLMQIAGDPPPRLDEGVLRRVCLRDPGAMEVFFDHFYDRIFGYAASLLRDRHLAEDLAHETFLRLHRSLEKIDPTRDPAPWVFTVVANLVRDHWRSRLHQDGKRQVPVEVIEQLPATGGSGPEERLEKEEAARAVRQALGEISEEDREVILLRTFQGLGTEQVAEVLGISGDAIRQRHSRAVKRLGIQYRRNRDLGQQ